MCACSEAFHTLRACAILVVGVAGSMPAHGIGTAWFVIKVNGIEQIMRIHNCLLCHGEDIFNLISVSQMLRTRQNEVTFSAEDSRIKLKKDSRIKSEKEKLSMILGLCEKEGLYELEVSPLYVDDDISETTSVAFTTFRNSSVLLLQLDISFLLSLQDLVHTTSNPKVKRFFIFYSH